MITPTEQRNRALAWQRVFERCAREALRNLDGHHTTLRIDQEDAQQLADLCADLAARCAADMSGGR